MICIVGESGAGKTTVQRILCQKDPSYHPLITYTTRLPRQHEKDGVDYHFISEEEYSKMSDKFCEKAVYNNWHYSTATEDCTEDTVAVVTPHGLRQFKKNHINVTSFYLFIPRRDRLIKLLERGDDIEEAYRRSLSDVGQFDGIRDEVDYTICNPEYTLKPEEIADLIIERMKGKWVGKR